MPQVSGCCQISRGVWTNPRSAFSCSGRSRSKRNGFPNAEPSKKDKLVYYKLRRLKRFRKKKKYISEGNVRVRISCGKLPHGTFLTVSSSLPFMPVRFDQTTLALGATNQLQKCFLRLRRKT